MAVVERRKTTRVSGKILIALKTGTAVMHDCSMKGVSFFTQSSLTEGEQIEFDMHLDHSGLEDAVRIRCQGRVLRVEPGPVHAKVAVAITDVSLDGALDPIPAGDTARISRFNDIIKSRSLPGVLVFGMDGSLLFFNEEVAGMVPGLWYATGPEADLVPRLPARIRGICKAVSTRTGRVQSGDGKNCCILYNEEGIPCSLRAFRISDGSGKNQQVMVLVEKIVDRHQLDFNKVAKEFELTRRELDVLKLVCQGMSNKEISEKIFVSEYTVKDHLKKIMRAIKAASRSEIIAIVSQLV